MSKPLKVRDGFATINGDDTVYTLPSGCLEIVSENYPPLLSMSLMPDGAGVTIHFNGVVKVGKRLLGSQLRIRVISSNAVEIYRADYEQ